jgi:hypothetical protein
MQSTFFDDSGGNPLLSHFIRNGDRLIHKWVDYFDVYRRSFQRFRGRPIKFLEIGVQNGGSAQMWKSYFGEQAEIIGVDIDPGCIALRDEGIDIWIGDQGDPEFWREFLIKHPCIDVVLDDGGHTMKQQITTFEALFPALSDTGVYLCEDTHSSYLPFHGGGLHRADTFLEYVKRLIDDMHAWYHAPVSQLDAAYMARHLYSLSIYDSIVVMEKRKKNPPLALARGSRGHVHEVGTLSHLDLRRPNGVPDES